MSAAASRPDGVRINLGSGHWKLEGWINVDLDAGSRPDVLANLARPLPFADGVAWLMHTEDFIDQLELEQAEKFLAECHRVLQPGGILRVLTPDLEKMTVLYLEDPDELIRMWRENVGLPLRLNAACEVMNMGMRFAGHRFMYDPDTLIALADRCGFDARQRRYNQSDEPELLGTDLRTPETALSMYFDLYRRDL